MDKKNYKFQLKKKCLNLVANYVQHSHKIEQEQSQIPIRLHTGHLGTDMAKTVTKSNKFCNKISIKGWDNLVSSFIIE